MPYFHNQFLFHTLFQCNNRRAQDVIPVSHKNAPYHVKVQTIKRNIFIYTLQNLLKRVPKNKEGTYLAMSNPRASRALRWALDPSLYKLTLFT